MMTTRRINGQDARVNAPMAMALDRAKKKARKPRPRPWVVCRIEVKDGEPVAVEHDRRTTKGAATNAAGINFYLFGGRWAVFHEPTGEWVCEIE